jgi:hypothetical protein
MKRRAMHRVQPWLLLAAALWLMGLGGGGQQEESAIPIPARNFTVQVTDQQQRTVQATRFTWEGKTHFRAAFGNASITLPFEKLTGIQIRRDTTGLGPNQIGATATLIGGETIEIGLDTTSKCYGETAFGTYEIFVKDLASVQFQ